VTTKSAETPPTVTVAVAVCPARPSLKAEARILVGRAMSEGGDGPPYRPRDRPEVVGLRLALGEAQEGGGQDEQGGGEAGQQLVAARGDR